MLILLPPSETKRPGGDGGALRLASLAHPVLTPQRETVIGALGALSRDAESSVRVLKLGRSSADDIAANARLLAAPTMPAIDRYTGVLYDALDAGSLDAEARAWLGRHVEVHSAPFGPVGALDPIPSYRLAAGAAVPGMPPLRRHWASAVTSAIAERVASFVLDLRSEAYVALGPVPVGANAAYARIVADSDDGAPRALNHFNKRTKGQLLRSLAASRPGLASVADLIAWGQDAGWTIRRGERGVDIVARPISPES